MCDGVRQCPKGDDEDHCHIECPLYCACQTQSIDCSSRSLTEFPLPVSSAVRLFNLSGNDLSELPKNMKYHFLSKLYLSHNMLLVLVPGTFKDMNNLLVLDISFNLLTAIRANTFVGLQQLMLLDMTGNDIHTLEPYSFFDLKSLPELHLFSMSIRIIKHNTFTGMDGLIMLDLLQNHIETVSDKAFSGLNHMQYLNLKGNPLRIIKASAVNELPVLTVLKSDHFKLCCMATQVSSENCFPPQDPISSCEDLMNNNVLRFFIWLFGFMAFLGNTLVVLWRCSRQSSSIPDLIISNLAISDLLMGIYMLIIASVDLYYKGVFIEYSDLWRKSWLCKISGCLATFSSEGSVMFLAVLTCDRFINILFPFSHLKLSKSGIRKIILIVWLLGFIVSALPLLPISYFGDNYYGRSGVCMALPITNEWPPGKHDNQAK